jgi:hypothetical protein
MKIEESIKQTGAFIRKVFKEVPEELSIKKGIRTLNVDNIVVKLIRTDGTELLFDGDETSQNRMIRAYTVLKAKNLTSTLWKMSDNTIKEIQIDEFIDAIELAGIEQSKLWFS